MLLAVLSWGGPIHGANADDSTDGLRFQVVYSESANLTYQLDVVSGAVGHIDPADYQALWDAEFLKSDADRAMVRDWAELKHRYQESVELSSPAMPLQSRNAGIDLSDAIRVAGLRTTDRDAFLDRASLLMTPTDTARLDSILRHFAPAFDAWWKREPAKKGQPFYTSLRGLLEREPVRGDLMRFRRFYAPVLPEGSTITFSLLYRPDRAKAPTNGQQIGNVAAVEFFAGEKPENRLDVVLHEMCHFLYMSRSEAATRLLQERFVATKDPGAKPALNLLNEGMASALGNGIIAREFLTKSEWSAYVAKPRSFYNNSNIDRAGKRTLQLMETWLTAGRTMDDPEFVPTYLASMKEEFGSQLVSPALFLTELFFFADERFGRPVVQDVRKTFQFASAYIEMSDHVTEQSLHSYDSQPGLSALFIVPSGKLDSLVTTNVITAAEATMLQTEAKKQHGAILAHPRSTVAYAFVIVAETPEEALALVKRLAGTPTVVSGLIPAVAP